MPSGPKAFDWQAAGDIYDLLIHYSGVVTPEIVEEEGAGAVVRD